MGTKRRLNKYTRVGTILAELLKDMNQKLNKSFNHYNYGISDNINGPPLPNTKYLVEILPKNNILFIVPDQSNVLQHIDILSRKAQEIQATIKTLKSKGKDIA